MLNYIWLGLIAVGIAFAVGSDCIDQARNTYRNGDSLQVAVRFHSPGGDSVPGPALVLIPAERFEKFYGLAPENTDTIRVWITTAAAGKFTMPVNETSPRRWRTMAAAAGTKDRLTGTIAVHGRNDGAAASIVFDPIVFPKVSAVTKAVLDYANTAVTIAFGLIGIMALWLGIMKIAEAAGAVAIVTKCLSPVMTRLFPEVPRDHPAMGAMVLNIAATMLGLGNAATPFGLKAMEELETLNPKKGTATNAMVTFLAINTAGLTLIPTTAIAVRLGLGSAAPAVIIGTSVFGAAGATAVGIATAKFLQRLPLFNRTGAGEEGKGG